MTATLNDQQKDCIAAAKDAQEERDAFEQFLRDKKFPVLPVWKDGRPFQNYALEVMFDAWQGRAALSTLPRASDAPATAALRPSDDDLWDKSLQERDDYHEWADKLANAISDHFGIDIGEHSSANNPWSVALDTLESMPATAAHAGAMQMSEQHIIAAIKKACGEYRTNDSYSFEDVWNCIEAAFAATPTPAATAPAALTDERIRELWDECWSNDESGSQNEVVKSFAHALLATNPSNSADAGEGL